jgi:hypothetical protein
VAPDSPCRLGDLAHKLLPENLEHPICCTRVAIFDALLRVDDATDNVAFSVNVNERPDLYDLTFFGVMRPAVRS